MKIKSAQGFTLIELLVVIAIIALLSGLAIVSLSSARNKANDAKVKSDIDQIKKTIIVEEPEGGTYETATIPVSFVPPICSGDTAYTLVTSTAGFAVSGKLCAATGEFFCQDSGGRTYQGTTTPSSISCPE